MKTNSLRNIVWSAACVAALTACGGSTDDEAGSPGSFHVSPPEVTFGTPSGATSCAPVVDDDGNPVPMAVVKIEGGVAPFTVQTAFPSALAVDRNIVPHRGESFKIYLLGGCLVPGTISITDSLNNLIVFKVTYNLGS